MLAGALAACVAALSARAATTPITNGSDAATVATAAALLAAPAAAQTGFIDTNGDGFVPLNGPIVLNQAFGPGQNIAGIVQLAPNPLATVTQSGFYNRTAIIQVDGTNTANITQF